MKEESFKKFKENEKSKFYVKGMIFIKDHCLIGLVGGLDQDIENQCPFVPFSMKKCNLKECMRCLNDCMKQTEFTDLIKSCCSGKKEGFNEDCVKMDKI
jgi:hypothetical protein